jgi:hypothetical protein
MVGFVSFALRFVRQVVRTEKDTSDWKTGKLDGKRSLTTQKEQKADYGASTCHGLATIKT